MAIGVTSDVRIPFLCAAAQRGTLVLLCSDGLHGVVDPTVIADTLARDTSLEEKCQFLINSAREAGGPDNITAVLLHANREPVTN